MKVLSDATRLRIIRALIGGPQNVSAIAEATGLDQPRVSHHLAKMRLAGLVLRDRDGRSLVYQINPAVHAGSSLDFGCCQISFRRL
jgi:ArsR family transcriptional regulator